MAASHHSTTLYDDDVEIDVGFTFTAGSAPKMPSFRDEVGDPGAADEVEIQNFQIQLSDGGEIVLIRSTDLSSEKRAEVSRFLAKKHYASLCEEAAEQSAPDPDYARESAREDRELARTESR